MAIHGSSYYGVKPAAQRGNSFNDNIQLAFGDDASLNQAATSSSSTTMTTESSAKHSVIVGFVFVLESLILIFVCVLAYFLR